MPQSLKVACLFVHYYKPETPSPRPGVSKSRSQTPQRRQEIVARSLETIQALAADSCVSQVDIIVCGNQGDSLLPITEHIETHGAPEFLPLESLRAADRLCHGYDLVMFSEDDIAYPPGFIQRSLRFAESHGDHVALIPNRIEIANDGTPHFVDLASRGHWTCQTIYEQGVAYAVHSNCHSGCFLLTARQFSVCHARLLLGGRRRPPSPDFWGGHMAGALAEFLSPLALFRPLSDPLLHTVEHQDAFLVRQPLFRERIKMYLYGVAAALIGRQKQERMTQA